jgi:hypothetical protein
MNQLQRKAVVFLSFVYGNAGPYASRGNNEFFRRHLAGEANPEIWQPSDACKDAFSKVMAGDYSMLAPRLRTALEEDSAERERMRKSAGVEIEG